MLQQICQRHVLTRDVQGDCRLTPMEQFDGSLSHLHLNRGGVTASGTDMGVQQRMRILACSCRKPRKSHS